MYKYIKLFDSVRSSFIWAHQINGIGDAGEWYADKPVSVEQFETKIGNIIIERFVRRTDGHMSEILKTQKNSENRIILSQCIGRFIHSSFFIRNNSSIHLKNTPFIHIHVAVGV